MYVPSYAAVARATGFPTDLPAHSPDAIVEIRAGALRLLLQYVALAGDFDEKAYLQHNPDVAEAHERGNIVDPRKHYIQTGYFEGRKASDAVPDENWYLEFYGDVADGVREGVVASAKAHFAMRGEAECRSPNPESLPWIREWADMLLRAPPPSPSRRTK